MIDEDDEGSVGLGLIECIEPHPERTHLTPLPRCIFHGSRRGRYLEPLRPPHDHDRAGRDVLRSAYGTLQERLSFRGSKLRFVTHLAHPTRRARGENHRAQGSDRRHAWIFADLAWICDSLRPVALLALGIAGGTGSGKTTVARAIAEALPPEAVAMIEHDAYYRDLSDLSEEERRHINFDHPDALETELLVAHLDALRAGRSIEAPLYDFKTHRRRPETRHIAPTPVLIVEGILVFVEESVRRRLDLKIFVDTDPDIRAFRRIRRDMEHRGRSFESIREQYYSTVRPMHLQFVEPSKRWADLIVPEGGSNAVALDLIIAKLRAVAGAAA